MAIKRLAKILMAFKELTLNSYSTDVYKSER